MDILEGKEEIHIFENSWQLLKTIQLRQRILKYPTYIQHHDKDEITLFRELREFKKQYFLITGTKPWISRTRQHQNCYK